MNNLSINITIQSLSLLTPIGPDTYQVVLKLYNNSTGFPLGSPYLPDSITVPVFTTSTTFSVNMPIENDNYQVNNVKIMAFANDEDDCCFAFDVFDISNVFTPEEEGNELSLSGYFADNLFRTRIANGVPPYSGVVRNFDNTVIYTVSSNQNDEIEIPNYATDSPVGGLKITLTDAEGKSGMIEYDNGTLFPMRSVLVGFSVSNGSANDHVLKIDEGDALGFNFTGVIAECSDIENDAQIIAIENDGVFNAALPLPTTPLWNMDKTVKRMMEKNTCNKIRWNWWWKRTYSRLNNGNDRTLFIGKEDAQMRSDGVTPIVREKIENPEVDDFFNVIIPSYAAPNTMKMAKRLTLMSFKRYLPYINSGNVIAKGSIFVTSGEGEQCSVYTVGESTVEEHMGSINTHGDFHPLSVAKFKSRFPEYSGSSNNDIATAPFNSDLNIKWRWHNNQLIVEFEKELADYIIANVPGLTRKKWLQVDSGSFVDAQAYFRCTFNSTERAAHPASFLFKSNDNSNLSADTVDFYLDHLTSLARKTGGIAICEPSPPNYEDPENTGYLVTEIQKAVARGAGISYYTPNGTIANNLTNAAGVVPGSSPKNKNEFKLVGGNKRLLPALVPISQVIVGGGFGGNSFWKNQWQSHRSTHQLTHVDTQSTDDVNPDSDPSNELTAINNYLNSNSGAYNGNILFDIDNDGGSVYDYQEGNYTRTQQLETMSLTKGVTAAVILSVMQDYQLTLDTTVGSLIPSWNNGARAGITLRQIIGHTSGIPDTGNIAGSDWTLETAVNELANNTSYPLLFTPGSDFSYSTTSYQVAARMAEIVSGQAWQQLFNSRIRDTCGMGAAAYAPGNGTNPNAGYGLWCSANEFRNFMTMIRNNGTYNGQSVLNSTSMSYIRSDMTSGLGNRGFGFIRNNVTSSFANEPTLESAKGCYAWVNFALDFSAVLFTQDNYEDTIGPNNGLRDLVRNEISSVI